MAKRVVDEEMRFTVVINGNEGQAELIKLEKKQRDLAQANKSLREEKARLEAQGKKNTAEYKNLTAQISLNNKEIKANKARMGELQKQIGITGLTMKQLHQRASQLRLQLLNMVPGSGQYKAFQQELKQINNRISELNGKSKAAKTSLGSIADGFNRYAALGASVIATLTGVALSIQKMIDYNGKLADAQSNVQKTTGLTAKEVDELSKSFGALRTRTARIELLGLAEEAGRLGITGVKNIQDFVEVANQMKVALGDDLGDEQIREVGKMVNVYKVGEATGRDFKNSLLSLGSAINEVAASGANQAGFLVDYLKRQAGVAAQTKLSAADNIGYAATFDELSQSVEVSATAMNKVWVDMFTDTASYAKIAGMSVKDFAQLLNTDANKAMIAFLKGLNGSAEGFGVMTAKLDQLGVDGARSVNTLTAIAGATGLLEKRQRTANVALQEATSLTNEYNLKNNNLAALLERVKRNFVGAFASPVVVNGLKNILRFIERLTTASGEHEKAARQERLELFKLQHEIFNSNTTTEKRIQLIEKLKEEHPELLKNLNAETASNKELREAISQVNEQLVNRIVLARKQDEIVAQAEETADRLNDFIGQEERLADAVARVSQNIKGFEFDPAKTQLQNAIALADEWVKLNGKSTSVLKQTSTGYFALKNAIDGYMLAQNKLNSESKKARLLEDEKERLIQRLGLNLNSSSSAPVVTETTNETTASTSSKKDKDLAKKRRDELAKEQAELLALLRKYEDDKLALIDDAFQREMAQNDVEHLRKIEDLQAKANDLLTEFDKAMAEGNTQLAGVYMDQYTAVLNQLDLEETNHQQKRNAILTEGVENHISTLQKQFEREEQLRQQAFNNELAALGDNEKAKEALKQQFEKESLERQKANQKSLYDELAKIINTANFEDFSLELLSEEELQQLKDRMAELGYSLSEIEKLLSALKNKKAVDELDGIGIGGDADLFGLTQEQWENMFANTETLAGAIGKIGTAINVATQAYSMFDNFMKAREQKRLQEIERNYEKESQKNKRLLDGKFISQRQYDDRQKALEDQTRKQKAEIEYKQAKREKAMNIANILSNQAVAVSKALAQGGFLAGPLFAAAVIAMAGAQLALAIAQPLPAKGYQKGFYGTMPVQREQDGKIFNAAFGGESRSGIVDKPTVFLAGEGGKNFPELIVDGNTLKQMNPDIKNSLYREIARARGYESGYYTAPKTEGSSNYETLVKNTLVMQQTLMLLEKLDREGVTAYFNRNMRDLQKLQEEFDRMNKIKNKAKV